MVTSTSSISRVIPISFIRLSSGLHVCFGALPCSAIPAQVPKRKRLCRGVNLRLRHWRFVLNYALSSRRQRVARFDFYGEVEEKSLHSQVKKTCCPQACQAREEGCQASGRK